MESSFEKKAGLSLVLFTVLMVFTMVLHPVGGNFEYLLKIKKMIIMAHAIALVSLPLALVGFWGLTRKLGTSDFFSISAFAIVSFGLVAAMMAATANGLVLPAFIQRYANASPDEVESLKPFLRYNFSVNEAFDCIYTCAFCLAILFWSISIIINKKVRVWIGYAGIIISVLAACIFISGIASANLEGFRIFVSLILLWIFLIGVLLIKDHRSIIK